MAVEDWVDLDKPTAAALDERRQPPTLIHGHTTARARRTRPGVREVLSDWDLDGDRAARRGAAPTGRRPAAAAWPRLAP